MLVKIVEKYLSTENQGESHVDYKTRLSQANTFRDEFIDVFQMLLEDLNDNKHLKTFEQQREVQKIYHFYCKGPFNVKVHSFLSLLENLDWGENAIVSFNVKGAINLLHTSDKKFNHLDFLKFVKKESLKKSKAFWVSNLATLRGYILLTQTKEVMDYFYDDLVLYFKGKSLSSPLFQVFIHLNSNEPKVRDEFIKNKKIYMPLFEKSFDTKNGEFLEFLKNLVAFLNDDSYYSLVPKAIDQHIFEQEGNSIRNSEFWSIDFDVLVKNLHLKSGTLSNTITYNLFLNSFVRCLKEAGWEIYLIKNLEGKKSGSKALLAIAHQTIDGITNKEIQDYFDCVVSKVMNNEILSFTISDFAKLDPSGEGYSYISDEVDKAFKITYQAFLMEYALKDVRVSVSTPLLKKQ